MSSAKKCDRCEKLYEPAPGTVDVEYDLCEKRPDGEGDDLQFQGWTVDLCPKCSAEFLLFIDHSPEES